MRNGEVFLKYDTAFVFAEVGGAYGRGRGLAVWGLAEWLGSVEGRGLKGAWL